MEISSHSDEKVLEGFFEESEFDYEEADVEVSF